MTDHHDSNHNDTNAGEEHPNTTPRAGHDGHDTGSNAGDDLDWAAFALAATHPDVPTTHRAACALGGRSDVVAAVAGAVRAGSAPAAPTTPAPTPEGDDPAVGAAADARQASEGLKGLAADLAARRATPGATT